jgi:hypothetical protein
MNPIIKQSSTWSRNSRLTLLSPRTIYAVAGLEWGMHRDVEEIHDKYWYWGKRLKRKVAYFFSTMTFQPWPKTVAADIKYVDGEFHDQVDDLTYLT